MKNKHLGTNFDDFLKDEGNLAETEAAAVKRVVAFQIEQMMKKEHLSKTSLAMKMRTSRSALERLLDPSNVSITLQTLERAALALDKRLKIELA
ncbi:MAG: XRE family transcriptional regulator [Desulfobacterales bacterium]|nr:XRE family transcriptional regulator [Desulfobacterales bacterium]